MSYIKNNVNVILSEVSNNIKIVAAVKSRNCQEIQEAIDSGINLIGHNYIQEAIDTYNVVSNNVKWHFIGHLQKNKVKKAVKIFDIIETIDSFELAEEISKKSKEINKVMSILIEINIGMEENKKGVLPDNVFSLVENISKLSNVQIKGLMTMGPYFENSEKIRPFFKKTKTIFDNLKEKNISNVDMKYLSMGMTNSYKVAIEEGANIIRIGTKIFGERK